VWFRICGEEALKATLKKENIMYADRDGNRSKDSIRGINKKRRNRM
jgi:hypothetical protein